MFDRDVIDSGKDTTTTLAEETRSSSTRKSNDDRAIAHRDAIDLRNEMADVEAARKARNEAKKAAEEQKAKEEQQAFHDSVFNDINNSVANADEMTKQQALNTASDGFNNYQSVGRAQSAAYSTNDDAYNAAAFNAENKMTNRQTAFNAAVDAGVEKLTAKGEQDTANNLAEAQKLGIKAETQQEWADTIQSVINALKGVTI